MALVCPVYFVGVIDGLYWYIGQRCPDPTYRYLSSSTPLTITPCPGNEQNCQNDGAALLSTAPEEMVFFKTTADDGAADYLGPNDRFPETPGTIDQPLTAAGLQL